MPHQAGHILSQEEKDQIELDKAIKLGEARLAASELSFSDMARLFSQGALMNFSDEFFAMVRSAVGDETYDEAILDERDELKKAQDKEGSLKYEMGGAMLLPLALAPFTGGATVAPTIGRYLIGTGGKLATQGAIQGATSSVGRQEGNIVDRVTDNKADIATSTATGAMLNPLVQKVGGKLVGAVTKIAEPIIRKIKGQLGKPIEDELARIAKTSGLEVDEIIEQIALGKTIPELSETVMAEIRGFYSKAGSAKPIIRESLQSRKMASTEDVFANLQRDLSPNLKEGNVLKFIRGSEKELQAAASKNYDEIYKNFEGFRSNNLNLAVQEALQKQPMLRGNLRSLMTGLGKATPFEIKDGVLTLTQDIDLRTAEKLRGLLFDRTNQLFQKGYGTLGQVASDLEKSLRNIINETSPDLSMARATWSKLKDAQTAFKDGEKVFTKKADLVDLEFEQLVRKGDMDEIEAFRAGVSSAIRGKKAGSSKIGFVNRIGDLTQSESLILQKIYPDEALDNVLDKINLAKASIAAESKIIQGSQTAETIEAAKRVGTVNDAYALARFIASGGADLGAGVQLLDKIIPKRRTQLTQEQMTEISQLLISENKDLLRRSLTNAEARETLVNNIARIADLLIRGGAKATVQEATNIIPNLGSVVSPAFSEELDPNMNNMETENIDTTSIKNLADELSPKTRAKVMKMYADGTIGEVYDDTGEEVVGTRRKLTQN
jgi:hypothetical protein